MTVTSSGIVCDVCDNYILPLMEDDLAYPFKLTVIANMLYACKDCIKIVKELDGSEDWQKLPDGALKRFFEKQSKEKTV